MKKKLRCLMTGGTGFLGSHVLRLMKDKFEVDVISRSNNAQIQGDLSRWKGGINFDLLKDKKYDIFLHLAGLYDLKATAEDVHMQNVVGTNMALQISDHFQIPVFINASSIAAASNQSKEVVSAYEINVSDKFPDPYSESKALGEQIVKNWIGFAKLKLNLRLGILVGSTDVGSIARIDGPYVLADSLKKIQKYLLEWPKNVPLLLPGNSKVRLPVVPVNEAAQAIVDLCSWSSATEESGYKSLHLSPSKGLAVEDLYRSTFRYLGLNIEKIQLIDRIPLPVLTKAGKMALGLPEESLRYAMKLPLFDSSDSEQILGRKWCSEFSEFEDVFWSGYEKHISNS